MGATRAHGWMAKFWLKRWYNFMEAPSSFHTAPVKANTWVVAIFQKRDEGDCAFARVFEEEQAWPSRA